MISLLSDGSDNLLPACSGCSVATSSLSDLLKVLLVGEGESFSSLSTPRGVRNSGVSAWKEKHFPQISFLSSN